MFYIGGRFYKVHNRKVKLWSFVKCKNKNKSCGKCDSLLKFKGICKLYCGFRGSLTGSEFKLKPLFARAK